MKSVNKVILIGNVGKDPEIKSFENGGKKASFSLATTERYRDKSGNDQTITEWHNIAVWGPQADVVEKYVRKGNPLYIEGRIKYRDYEDNGVKKRFTEIIIDNFSMLGAKPASGTDAGVEITGPDHQDNESTLSPADDLPF